MEQFYPARTSNPGRDWESTYILLRDGRILAYTEKCGSKSIRAHIKPIVETANIGAPTALKLREEGAKVLLFVRDPLDRLVSAWTFFQKQKMPFEKWLNIALTKPDRHWRPQVEAHTWNGEFIPNRLYPLDLLTNYWGNLFQGAHPMRPLNQTEHKDWAHYVNQLSRDTIERVIERYVQDIDLYARVVELADTAGLDPAAARLGGSTPSTSTNSQLAKTDELRP